MIHLNRKRTTGQRTAINAIVTWQGKQNKIATGVTVLIADWDCKQGRCKTDHKANARLTDVVMRIEQYMTANGHPPRSLETAHSDLQPITATILQHGKSIIRRTGKENSFRAYSVLVNNLDRYHSEKKRTEKYVQDVTQDYIEGFLEWLVGKQYSDNHTWKMMSVLRGVIRRKVPADRWETVKPPAGRPKDTVYLSVDEIEKIENVILPPEAHLSLIRDVFLCGYYTGQRFSDWPQINLSRVWGAKIKMLTIHQEKTQAAATIPVQPRLQAIFDRYPTGLPAFTNQYFNREIKELARKAGIVQMVSVSHYRGRKLIVKNVEKWKMVSSHTARRSFATNAYLEGIPVIEIMKFTGHKSLSAFMTYIRITGQEAAMNYANHPFFGGKREVLAEK